MFSSFNNSLVSVLKEDGSKYENIDAVVQTNTIFIEDVTVVIEEGDKIIRETSNGMEEQYLVLDRGFYEKQMGFQAHYQVKVKKIGTYELSRPQSQTIIYNLHGANSRVNNNSTDRSINIIETSSDSLFDDLRKVISEKVDDENQKQQLRNLINEMENNKETNKFNEIYTKFITGAANHMTVLSPFIPALSQMIHS